MVYFMVGSKSGLRYYDPYYRNDDIYGIAEVLNRLG